MGLRGNLSHFGVADVLQLLAGQAKSGTVRITRPGGQAAFVLEAGAIVSTWDRASSASDPLKSFLLRRGVLPENQVMKALRLESHTELSFGEILLREGMMDLPELSRHLTEQIREEIRRVLAWDDGLFEFVPEIRVRTYGPGCAVKIESVLLQAAHEVDEALEERKAAAAPSPSPVSPPTPAPAAPAKGTSRAALVLLAPVIAFALSFLFTPPPARENAEPLLGMRVASFHGGREVRNLRLVLEMYRALNDRYPAALSDLVGAGLLSAEQVAALRNHDVRYRALRGGGRYVLHSGGLGPLVRALPEEAAPPPAAGPPARAADMRRGEPSSERWDPAPTSNRR